MGTTWTTETRSRMIKFLVLGLALVAFASAQSAQGNVSVLGDITVTGALRTSKIRSNSLTVDGSINVVNTITAETLTAESAESTVLETPGVSSPTGVIHIQGPMASSDASVNATLHASSFIQREVKQWALAVHEDFEEKVNGWSSNAVSACEGNKHLAGHCQENGGEVSKTFSGLGKEHTHLRIQANFHFLDSWEGESAYLKIGDKVVWTDMHDTRSLLDGVDVCGGEHPDTKMAVPIDVTIRHTDDSVDVAFGGLLDEHPCNESFGVDDVMISVR